MSGTVLVCPHIGGTQQRSQGLVRDRLALGDALPHLYVANLDAQFFEPVADRIGHPGVGNDEVDTR